MYDQPDFTSYQPLDPRSVVENIFRAYDIRGVVDRDITADTAYTLGLAVGSEALSQDQRSVITGADGRLSSPRFSQALIQGLRDSGCDVIDIGTVPTPLVYFATHKLATQSGVMVTGSHNPPDQNGFKIVIAGTTLSAQAIQGLKQRILEQDFSQGQGQIQHKDITDLYRDTVCDKVNLNRQKPLKVAIDCGNGVAGLIVPDLLNQLGVEVLPLFTEVDGHFPNHHPDPSQPKNLAQLIELVKTQQADVGLAFDGDGDRLGVVTETGKIIYPDQLVSLFAQAVLKQHQGAKVIYDVKCSRHLADIIKAAGGEPMMWKTGHSLIKAKLKQSGALLAGEMSGHIFFQERWYGFDDAAYSAVRLLEILSHTKLSLGQLMASFPQDVATPELSIDTEDEAKFHIIEGIIANEQQESSACFKGAQLNAIDGLRVDFTKGWGLIRASNTTAKLVLRFEAADEATLKAIQQKFKQAIQQVDAALDLPF